MRRGLDGVLVLEGGSWRVCRSPTLAQGQTGSDGGGARSPAGPPSQPIFNEEPGLWGPLVSAEAFTSRRGLRHLFIFSAVMHELPEKRVKVQAFLDAGITAKEQARAAGMAVTR